MDPILLIILILIFCGGGWGFNQGWNPLLAVLLILLLCGGGFYGYHRHW